MDDDTEYQFKAAFLERTAAARIAAGFTQAQAAKFLHMDQDKYKQYEIRTPLPHYLIGPFCELMKIPVAQLFDEKTPSPRRVSNSSKKAQPLADLKRAER